MEIENGIDEKYKLIGYGILIIICILFAIKSLNLYYEEQEERKMTQITQNEINETTQSTTETEQIINSVENDTIRATMTSFVNYCNNREIENAYKMLTDQCKNAMFPSEDYFKNTYLEKIYNEKKIYDMLKWSEDGNKTTYLVKLYGDLLATGGVNADYTEDYYTFVKNENGTYKININNYIYGEERNIEETINGITIKVEYVNVYEEYEDVKITFINNTSKTICLNGNKSSGNIYLQNGRGTKYSALNDKFEKEEIVMKPKETQSLWIEFNKVYSSTNKAQYLTISDIILDYEDYLNSIDKDNYFYRTSFKIKYQK